MKDDVDPEWAMPVGALKEHEIVRCIRNTSKSISYLAKDSKTGRRIVLTYLDDKKILEKFKFNAYLEGVAQDELEATAEKRLQQYKSDFVSSLHRVFGLGSEHVAVTHGIGTDPNKDCMVVVSEYVPGLELSYAVARLEPIQCINLFAQALEGLDYIHKKGFLHLNVKPSRIRVDLERDPPLVKFTDFGFATPRSGFGGAYSGTPLFMAPEMILEQRAKIDERADLYSLAVTMYFCLTGHDPLVERFSVGMDKKKLIKIVEGETFVPPPSNLNHKIPAELDEIIINLMKKDPDERDWRTADALLNAFYEAWPEESRKMPHEKTSTYVNF